MKYLIAFLLLSSTGTAFAGEFFEVDGLAMRGYDVVAYHSGAPAKGDAAHAATYLGSKFLFSTAENRRVFEAAPAKYAPQFGGYCALGTANGYKVSTQPDAYRVVDGKLYLNYDRSVLKIWSKDTAGYIQRAESNWPEVSKSKQRD
jgi:YHS domain-containing protein